MKNNFYEKKHHRGSSPLPQELERGLLTWMRRLRYIEEVPEGLSSIHHDKQSAELVKDLTVKESTSGPQPDPKEDWQDDGGES